MRAFRINFLLAAFFYCSAATAQSIVKELPNPTATDATAWDNTSGSIQVSFADDATRYPKENPYTGPITTSWQTTAWKGEKVHTQFLIQSKNGIPVTIKPGPLKNSRTGTQLQLLQAGLIRYVMTDEFGTGCGYRKSTDYDSSLVEDRIENTRSGKLEARTIQPVWVSAQIPRNIPAGTYTGEILVEAGKTHKLRVSIIVNNRILPEPKDWSYDLDLWQHPYAVARIHKLKPWSNAHFEKMRPYYTMLAAAGQKAITASIIDEPWNHQTYDDYPSMIQWNKKKDGSWYYDYSLFDQYISFAMSCGITKRINCYTMIPWKLSFTYFDEATGKYDAVKAEPGTEAYNTHWGNFLRDFEKHLKAKNWFHLTSISMDERPMKHMQAVIKLLKGLNPEWKITMAGNYHPEIEKDIYDYCIASRFSFEPEVLARRKAAGMPTTYYTCCTEPYPNGFSYSPPDEHVWISWYAAAAGFTGYLRWAYNSWVENPATDTRFRSWPGGDAFQVYPGPETSIRFEKMIEGIQDFEKIRILKAEWEKKKNTQNLKALETILADFDLKTLNKIPAKETVKKAKAWLQSR